LARPGFRQFPECVDPALVSLRYKLGGPTELEIHVFDTDVQRVAMPFTRFGFNHICLQVEGRSEFLRRFPASVEMHRYNNPGGWENVFIRDFEGNWVEIREQMPAGRDNQ